MTSETLANGRKWRVLRGRRRRGTGTYPAGATNGVWKELQCGSYVFMDADYRRVLGPTANHGDEHALFGMSSVMSKTAGRTVGDAGLKLVSLNSDFPTIADTRMLFVPT